MDIYEQAVHLLEGEETHIQKWFSQDGEREIEYKTWGPERWIRRARERGVLTGLEFLAVILFVVEELGDERRARGKMTSEWVDAIDKAIDEGEITSRSYDSYLPIKAEKGSWDWVLFLKDADAFVQSRGMEWTCTAIVEHLYSETFPTIEGSGKNKENERSTNIHTTKELELLDEAKKKFWLDYDRSAPPKKEIIVKWFTDRGVSKGVAESLDTAMRPTEARKGGNKRVAPT